MSKRQKRWARKKREELLDLLGRVCVHKDHMCTDDLEFDCISTQGHTHHAYDTSHRMSFYWRQYREGNLQVLCHYHNALKGTTEISFETAARRNLSNDPF